MANSAAAAAVKAFMSLSFVCESGTVSMSWTGPPMLVQPPRGVAGAGRGARSPGGLLEVDGAEARVALERAEELCEHVGGPVEVTQTGHLDLRVHVADGDPYAH